MDWMRDENDTREERREKMLMSRVKGERRTEVVRWEQEVICILGNVNVGRDK